MSLACSDLMDEIDSTEVHRKVSERFMQSIWDLKRTAQLADATVQLDDGRRFIVHRAILAACSEYFRALFTTTLHETQLTFVHLPGIKYEILEVLLNYVYMKKVRITPFNVGPLLVTSDYLCILGIKELCCEYLKQHLNPANCLSIRLFARDHFCKDLEDEAHNYIMRNFIQVAASSSELMDTPVEVMEAIIGANELNIKSEEVVWEVMLKWINYDPEYRKKYLVRLMSKIRLGLLETQYFLENVKDHPYVVANDLCRPVIIDTLKFLYDLEMITQKDGEVPTPLIARPRIPHEILFAIGGWSGGSPTNVIETYDTRADRWINIKEVDATGPRAYHGTAVIGFNIYVVGGFDGMEYFNSCRCFDAANKTWREIAPMNSRRCYVSTVVLDEIIYALGGYDGHHRQNTAEKYDYTTNQWSLITPMHCQRSDASATILNRKIYITGGFNGTECMNTAEVFDPETSQWSMITPMRSRRSGVSCIAYHNSIYVIGGFNGISRMCSGEKFDPNTNTWSTIPDMYNPRSNFAIEVIDDMVFAIGGFNGVTTIYHVECYDERTNEWYEATDMNVYRSAVSACVIMGLPNIHDYIHKHRESLMEEKRQKLLALSSQRHINENATNNQDQQNNNPSNVINRNINNANLAGVAMDNNNLLAIQDALAMDQDEQIQEE